MNVSRYKKSSQALFDGIHSLFHYQPLGSEQHKIWLTETLLENKIYCSNPADFNDPWDMKPLVKEVYNKREVKEFIEYLRNQPLSISAVENVDKNIANHDWVHKLAQDFVSDHCNIFEKIFRVYCLTLKQDNLLMWSHYADNHRGICLEFDTNNIVFGSAWAVKYHTGYSYLPWRNDHDEIIPALTKAKCWMYEKEYRVLPKTEHPSYSLPDPLIVGSDNKLLFPPDALKSVIVGCKANYDEILSFIRSIRPDLPVKRAIMSSNRYGLHIE
ncbi:DUF2971 domain-containing protein [Pectobacterium brasiliense]|uniref:DUF2971 domain-containing protein n=1 Tax=Pectobacterium brasiliense TaxID=180957 RepID=UPI00196908B8|nr:DUF2971 domain-containing protein [Pectobacterium brasiliense]MBN3207523.1 DUF2971 domain-containing protein [Pectobacterium brasiliense]